jgi:hypothetical protein
MHASLLLVSALATSVWAAPTYPNINAADSIPDNVRTLSEYFNLLASKVQDSRFTNPPVCDLSQISLPAGKPPPTHPLPPYPPYHPNTPLPGAADLPPPTAGLTLKHIAIGRGTQNYTCDPAKPTLAPIGAGAVATLFNASCLAALSPDLASTLGRAALHFPVRQSEATQHLAPSNLALSGVHFFTDATTALFKLDSSPRWHLGEIPCGKNASAAAPADAPTGLKGEGAVAWLKLNAKAGATGGLQEVYRVETVGGSPPKTCEGMGEGFEVQYATQ